MEGPRREPEEREPLRQTPVERERYPDTSYRGDFYRRDLVRWGPIVAGVVSALGLLILLSLLGAAIGLSAAPDTGGLAQGSFIWGAIAAIIAFFVGGWVAARTSAVGGTFAAVINGALVWGFAVVFSIFLSVLGLGALFGALGAPTVDGVGMAQAAAVGTLIVMLLTLGAAIVGGLLGTRSEIVS